MEIGVLEILTGSAEPGPFERLYEARFRRHYASIAPQAVAVWCRRLGHRVHYATWYGQSRLDRLLPRDLDVLFVASYTQASLLAYAVARLYKRTGTRTVLGGPHARAFPRDAARFFDLVVQDCDQNLVADILGNGHRPGSVVTSGRQLREIPSVEERLPEISKASFRRGRRMWLTHVPLLTSVGCPYRCDFCSDWNNPYQLLPEEGLREDLRFVSQHLPGVFLAFHDPNFGVRFDAVLNLLEELPPQQRHPYLMESSLAILRSSRLERLRHTRCVYVAPGVESWADYSNKAGVGQSTGRDKLEDVVAHFEALHEHVPGLQANFIFGIDTDRGEEPVALTREFIRRTPFVWPTLNIPVPFGGTPLHDRYREEGRLLETMPFVFYYLPHLVLRLRHYDPVDYYGKLIALHREVASPRLLLRRLRSAKKPVLRGLHLLRTLAVRQDLAELRRVRRRMKTDAAFRAFHEGRSRELPTFYRAQLHRRLGSFRELFEERDLIPVHEPIEAPAPAAPTPEPDVRLIGNARVASA